MAEVKKSWFSKISSRGEALKQLRHCSIAFLAMGIFTGVVSVISNPAGLIDAALIIVATFFMFMHHSRVAVVLLLLLSLFNFAAKFAPLLGFNLGVPKGGLLIPAIVLFIAIRAAEAVFVLNKEFSDKDEKIEPSEV